MELYLTEWILKGVYLVQPSRTCHSRPRTWHSPSRTCYSPPFKPLLLKRVFHIPLHYKQYLIKIDNSVVINIV